MERLTCCDFDELDASGRISRIVGFSDPPPR
jgi:hypothetical protein